MGSESIAHEGERNNYFSKIQLVGQKFRDNTTFAILKLDLKPLFWFSRPALFATSEL